MRNLSVNFASAEDHISSLDSPACEFKCEITNSMQFRRKAKSQIVFHNWVKHKLLFLLHRIGLHDMPMEPSVLYFGSYTVNNATDAGSFFEATLSCRILSYRGAHSSQLVVHSEWSLSDYPDEP